MERREQTAENPVSSEDSVRAQLREYIRLIRASKRWPVLVAFAFGIVVVIAANAYMQVRLNTWQGDFYDAIEQRQVPTFIEQLGVFIGIVAVLLTLGVSQTWFHEMLKIRLRESLARDLINEWLRPGRGYKLPLAGHLGENPDQRIHDDARRLSELTTDLGVGLFQSTLLLGSFIGVLWVLSAQVVFVVDGESFSIPGYMVWSALAYAAIGSTLTWFVGKPLVKLNTQVHQQEGKLRFSLVRANESSEGIAIYRGEATESGSVKRRLDDVIETMRQVAGRLAMLTWVTSGYGWLALVVPILIAAPGYFSGTLSFGGLMKVVGAFAHVQQSLRWFVDNFRAIAEWRAMLWRVIRLRNQLVRLEKLRESSAQIRITRGSSQALRLEGLSVLAPHGRISLDAASVEIARGEHVLVTGAPGADKSTLFHALAGLWPWGEGAIEMPASDRIMFLPHRPYMPLGTLRAALAYPGSPDQFTDAEVRAALARVGLSHLTHYLDQDKRWDQELLLDEQQRIAFVRVLLHRPEWVIQDEALSELDPASRHRALETFAQELRDTAFITVGHLEAENGFYKRHLQFVTRSTADSHASTERNNASDAAAMAMTP